MEATLSAMSNHTQTLVGAMAAIYSGIHLKLKSPQTPWEDKIKLARFAWISSQCLLPNKEQVLLDWCTHALTGWYNKKVDFPQNVLEGLWCYLDYLLHSRKIHSFLKQGKSLSLRLNMAQLLLDRFQDHGQSEAVASVSLSTLLSVCQGILSTPALCSVFTTKYELMVSLLSRLISLACHQLHQVSGSPESDHESDMEVLQSHPACYADKEDFDRRHEDNLQVDSKCNPKTTENLASDKLFEVLLLALTCYSSVQRQQANPNRIFTLVTNQLFQPMIFLRHWLSQAALSSPTPPPVSQQMCRDIRTKIDTIFQLALFAPEHMSLYQEELTKVDSEKRVSGAVKGPLRPTRILRSKLTVQNICAPSLYYAVKSNIVPVLFKLFVESYGTTKGEKNEEQGMLCFFFLASLSDTLDLGLESHWSKNTDLQCPSPQSAPCRPESWSLALLTIDSLLNSALLGDIYNVAADRIRHGEIQLKFYQSLAEMLLKQAQPSIPAWYRCLKTLLCLNHLILEPDLEQLLSLAWVNMDCTDSRVLRAKQVTVCTLLQTCTKLRQMPKFFSDLLSVISETAMDQPRPPLLSEEVLSILRTCFLDTPPSQTIEICSLVLQSIKNHIPQKQTITDDLNVQNDGAFNADSSLKIMFLSQILHSVLFSLKTLDNGSPLPLVRQSQNLMERMYEVIKELQQHLAKMEMKTKPSVQKIPKKKVKKGQKVVDSKTNMQFNQNTLEATLLLRYTWVEVDTLFSIHCSKYMSLEPVHQGTSENENQTTSASLVMECIQSLLSGEIFPQSAVTASSQFSSLLLRHLVLQQMKKILSMPLMLSNSSSMAVLNQAAHFIAAGNDTENCLSVEQKWDGQLYTVNASSYLVAYWYLVTSNLPLILPYLGEEDLHSIATLLVGSQLLRPTQEDILPNSLTVSLISSQLLKSHIFPELPNLFSATVQHLLQRVIKVLRTAQPNLDIFQNTSQIQKEMVVELILASLANGKACVELSSAQTKDILNMLQIIKVLNPDGMSSEDLTTTFLLLVFMLTSTTCQTQEDNRENPSCPLLHGLLEILICLLEGSNFPSVLKFIHGGTLLQAVVSSVLLHSIISTENPDWFDLIKELQAFINCLVQLIITRSSSAHLNLKQFASFLCSKETKDKLTDRANSATVTAHVLVASLSTFSCTLTSNLGKSKSLDELVMQILTQTTATLGVAVKSLLKPQAVLNLSGIISDAFVVDVVTVMLKCELSLHSIEENKQTHSISHMPLYQGSSLQVLKEINSAPRPREFLVSSLRFLSTFYSAVEMTTKKQENNKESKHLDDLFMTILHSLQRLLTVHWISSTDLHDLEPALQKLLCHLVEKCSFKRFNLMLLMIKEGLDIGKLRGGNYTKVLSTVILVKLLFCCPLPEVCFNALWLIASQIISTMMFLINSSSQDISLNLPFTVPVVTTVTTLLRQGEGVIANPHHVTMVLGALQCVPLDHLAPAVYEATFTALHESLFAIIKCHPQVMLKAAPSFLNVFYRLVASIMQEGKQRKDSNADSAVYLRCAMLVERMYSHIAAASEDFTTLSAFMVAQYVTEMQKVTLRPDVKLHLTEGIYMILDLCLEQDIKFLMAGLQMGVREVFNELYSSYTHYHKTQRQGEEKYTVCEL